jgi:hypothetical protein
MSEQPESVNAAAIRNRAFRYVGMADDLRPGDPGQAEDDSDLSDRVKAGAAGVRDMRRFRKLAKTDGPGIGRD